MTATLPSTKDPLRLPDEVERAFRGVAHRKTLQAGDSLFLKGSPADALFGVISGLLRVSVVAASGREAVIAMLEPGHWFGEVSLLVGNARVYDTYAVDATEVAMVTAADFHRLLAARPEIHMAITRLVCLRLQDALSWIDDVILMPLPVRLAHRLLALDTRLLAQGKHAGDAAGARALGVTQEDLASMLGVSRQSVNRQLKLWEDEGILRLDYRRIELVDRKRLERHAAQAPA